MTPGMPPQQAFRDGLAQRSGWLLVFDNAEERKMLTPFLPVGGKHHVIVTSRRSGWNMAEIGLNVWSREQALPFLRQRLPAASAAALLLLSDALGGLPLALEQACAYLKHTQATVEDYLAALAVWESGSGLLQRQDSDDYPLSVCQTLALAFDKLSAPARALLALCGWLGPEPIPEYLFGAVDEEWQNCLLAELLAAVQRQLGWRKTVAELASYALCQTEDAQAQDAPGSEREGGRYLMFHRLTQTAIRAALGDGEAANALGLLRAAFPGDVQHQGNWPRCRVLMPHVQQLDGWHRDALREPRRHRWLLDRLGRYLRFGPALYAEAERLLRRALEIGLDALGEEDPDTLAARNNLADTLWARGDFSGARALLEKNLEIYRRTLGDEHPDTLGAMGNLAVTMQHQGDFPSARALQEIALEIYRRTQGDEHQATLTAMGNLAMTLNKQGDFSGARALDEKTLEIRRRTLRDEHPATLTAMGNLAVTLNRQGDFLGARALEEKTLGIHRRTLGGEHPDTLVAMHNLAMTLRDQGDFPAARALLASAHPILCRVLGEQHPNTLATKRILDAIPS